MSDDLVARLRVEASADWRGYPPAAAELCAEAADRIEALEAERDALREALREVLEDQAWVDRFPGFPAKKMLNSVRVSTYERWRALLDPEDGER